MTDLTTLPGRIWPRIDKAWAAVVLLPLLVAVLDPGQAWPTVTRGVTSLIHTMPVILFATLCVAWMRAAEAESVLARAFEGRQSRMIVMAALLGGLSPFCSCEVIPFVAAMLAVGAPISAVMAFWLASPLMDPAMFVITANGLGLDFAVAKGLLAIAIGVAGGFATMALRASPVFADPLRARPALRGCCAARTPEQKETRWAFWGEARRRTLFREVAVENVLFLTKWLLLAYMLEALMLAYVPADAVAGTLGGEGFGTIALAAVIGAPAYLNGYAAVPLVATLVDQGMGQGAAMAFVIGGGISCIPAALAVWALVKPRVFAAYIGYAFAGSLAAGTIWQALA
ncbi:MAG: permease [Paracoccaceae bacterium]